MLECVIKNYEVRLCHLLVTAFAGFLGGLELFGVRQKFASLFS